MKAGRFLIFLMCLAALVIPASATMTIDFAGTAAGTGSITGDAATSTGTNILIQTVTGEFGVPLHNGVTDTITNGALNFSASSGSYNAITNIYSYTGGTFKIIGGDAAAGIADGSTLVQGTISSLTVDLVGGISLATVGNNINAALAAYYGVATGPLGGTPVEWTIKNGSIHLANETGGGGGSYSASTFSTDLPDTPVPEPASVVMLGSVLLGITHVVRRRATKA